MKRESIKTNLFEMFISLSVHALPFVLVVGICKALIGMGV